MKTSVYAATLLGIMTVPSIAAAIEPTVYVCFPTDEGEAVLDNIVEIATTKADRKRLYAMAEDGVRKGFYTDCYHEGGSRGYLEVKSVAACKKHADDWYGNSGGALVIISCVSG